MTIASATARNDYTGNGATVTFAYTFEAVAASDLRVILTDTSGTETVQTITTHYTVSGVGSPSGGNVTFLTAPTDQYLVSIISNMPRTQTADLANESGFFQERIEAALDRAVRIAQQVHGVAARGVVTPEHEPAGIQLPSKQDRADSVIGFDSNGDLALAPYAEAALSTVTSGKIVVSAGSGAVANGPGYSSNVLSIGDGTSPTGKIVLDADTSGDRAVAFNAGGAAAWEVGSQGGADNFTITATGIDTPLDIPLAGNATFARNMKFAGTVGFNNAAPLAKPTIVGSRGGNAALANLLTQLASYGLITDGTSA